MSDAITRLNAAPLTLRNLPSLEEVTMIRRVFLAFLVFGLVACGDDGVSPENPIIGTWEFESIMGGDVTAEPTTWTFTTTTLTIVATTADCTETANYTLDDDGTLTFTITSVNGLDCDELVGDVITGFTATVSADTLTLVFDESGITFTVVFKRVN